MIYSFYTILKLLKHKDQYHSLVTSSINTSESVIESEANALKSKVS